MFPSGVSGDSMAIPASTPSKAGISVAVIAPPYYPIPRDLYGGIETVAVSHARILREFGFVVTLVAPRGSDPSIADSLIPVPRVNLQFNRLEGVGSQDLISWMLFSGALRFPLSLLSARLGPVNVVLNDAFRFEPHNAVVTSTLFGVHRTINILHGDFDSTRLYVRAFSGFYRKLILGVLNQGLATHLQSKGYRAFYLPNGVDVRDDERTTSSPGDYFVFVGRIDRAKAPHVFVRLACRTHTKLFLIGPVHDRTYFDKFIRPYLSEQIVYLGEVPRQLRQEVVKAARGLMYTSTGNDPQPAVLLESLTVGVPIIAVSPAGRYTGFFDAVQDGRNGIVAKSPEELEPRLVAIDRLNRQEVAREARNRWGWSNVVRRHYLPVFEAIISESL